MVTVGLLYPGHSAEDDYPALEARLTPEHLNADDTFLQLVLPALERTLDEKRE